MDSASRWSFAISFVTCIVVVLFGIGGFGQTASGQETANFGYSVDGFEVTVDVLSPKPGSKTYYYGWSLNDPCDGTGATNCYDVYGTSKAEVTINTTDYISGDPIEPQFYLDVANASGKIIAETNKAIQVGPGKDYSDSDGDGTKNAQDDCPQDPANTCQAAQKSNKTNNDSSANQGDSRSAPQGGLVNCGRAAPGEKISNWCDYKDLINLISLIINWLIGILVLVATLLFMYAGILYLTAGADESQAEDAKNIFINVLWGFAIVLLAWLLVSSLVGFFVREDWQDRWQQVIPISLSFNDDNVDIT